MEQNVFIPNMDKRKRPARASLLRRCVPLAGFLVLALGVWYGADYMTSVVVNSSEYVANDQNAASVALSGVTSIASRDQLLDAQVAMQRGDTTQARATLQDVVAGATTQTDALLLLTQIDLAEGNTDAAITNARRVIALEPDNPNRYYQLGVLFMSAGRTTKALEAYDAALQLDPVFANARYFLALLLAESGDLETAITQLEIVAQTNPDNEDLAATIAQLEAQQINVDSDTSTGNTSVQ